MISILFFTILACTLMGMVASDIPFTSLFTFILDPELKNALNVLGVKNTGDARKAYMNLCRKYHSDKNRGGNDEQMKIINGAYEVVKNRQNPQRINSNSLQRRDSDSLQRRDSQVESLPSVGPSRMDVTINNLKGGLSTTGANMAGMIVAGTIGNVIAPNTFQKIPLDVIGNQLIKTTITSTVVANVCVNSIECNVIGAILTNTVMDAHLINRMKVKAINDAKIILKENLEYLKNSQDIAYNNIGPDEKASMELLRDYVYNDIDESNFIPKKIGKTELVISRSGVKICEILVNSNYVVSIFDIKSEYIIHVFRTSDGTGEQITKQGTDNVFTSSVIKSDSPLSDVIKQIHLTLEEKLNV